MKKKFVLTLALVLMVAVTLTAATPLEVSGKLEAGYKFTFGSANSVDPAGERNAVITASVAGDYWKVSLGGDIGNYGDNKQKGADVPTVTADIYLDKALKEEGVDLGDFALTLHAGANVGKGAPSLFAKKGHDAKEVKMTKKLNTGLTIGYADLVKVFFAFYPNAGFPMVVGATINPVDGVGVTVGYTNNKEDAAAYDLLATTKVDVAKLADLDFDLAMTAQFAYNLDNKDAMVVGVDAAANIEGIDAFVAYQLAAKKHGVAVGAAYETEIEGFTVGGGVKFLSDDLENIADDWNVVIDASASYVLGGVTYKLGAGFDVADKAFSLTPTVSFSF